nr:hypothetical protein [Tanacetum cinerariifolium]
DDEQTESKNDDEEESTDNKDDEEVKELYDDRVSALEIELSELKQTNQFSKAISSILGIVDKYLAFKMKEAVDVVVQLQTNKLREEAQAENKDFLNQTAYAVAASLSELELKKILMDKMKEPSHNVEDISKHQDQDYVIGEKNEKPDDREATKFDWFKKPERPPTPDYDRSKRRQIDFQPPQTWISQAAQTKEPPASFYEFNATTETLAGAFELVESRPNQKVLSKIWNLCIPKEESSQSSELKSRGSMTTVILKRLKWVEDLQLGVESYQKKLNLTKPDTYRSHLRDKTAYTSHSDPHGIIYLVQSKRNRLMRTDELHKFSDGTLNDVHTAHHDIDAG